MSIFDIFRNATSSEQQPQQQAPTQAGTPVVQGTPGNIPPNVDPTHNPAIPQEDPGEKVNSPLDEFASLWEPNSNEGDAGSEQEETPALTEEALAKVVSNADFTKSVSPELFSTIAAGGEDAVTAMAQVMNAVARDSFSKAVLANNKLTEQAVEKALERERSNIPKLLRDQAATNHLNESNPVFQNPAIKPVIEATKSQLLEKFPNATNEQIASMTKDYILAMAEAFSDKLAGSSQEGSIVGADVDWEAFLTAG